MEQIAYNLIHEDEALLVIRDEKLYDTASQHQASILAWMMNEGDRKDLPTLLLRHRDDSGITF